MFELKVGFRFQMHFHCQTALWKEATQTGNDPDILSFHVYVLLLRPTVFYMERGHLCSAQLFPPKYTRTRTHIAECFSGGFGNAAVLAFAICSTVHTFESVGY